MPPASDIGTGPMIMLQISKSLTDRCTHVEQSLEDRGDEEELVDNKLGCVDSMDNQIHPYQVFLQLLIWAPAL